MSLLDRDRASRLLIEAGADALVVFQPENFTYVTGATPGTAAMWRRAGGATALVPTDAASALVAIVGDQHAEFVRGLDPSIDIRTHRLWIDTVDVRGETASGQPSVALVQAAYERASTPAVTSRPTTFDTRSAFNLLHDALAERGMERGSIAADLAFLPVADFQLLKESLPLVHWIDGTEITRRLRAIKSPREITWLREAAAVSEAGFRIMPEAIVAQRSRADLSGIWRDAVRDEAARRNIALTDIWDYISVGSDPWSPEGAVADGSVVKVDAGTLVHGYSSDTARSYVYGTPSPLILDIYALLLEAFETGLTAIRPGAMLRDVYDVTLSVVHKAGLTGYRRGHFGHGLGASVGSEEWPFIAADSDVAIEPGMVLAFETPFYGKGIGSLTIEDQLLVTETGVEIMTTLPRHLLRIG